MLSVNYVNVLFINLFLEKLRSISWLLHAVINKNVTKIVVVLVLLKLNNYPGRKTETNDYALCIYKNKDKCSDGLKKHERTVMEKANKDRFLYSGK